MHRNDLNQSVFESVHAQIVAGVFPPRGLRCKALGRSLPKHEAQSRSICALLNSESPCVKLCLALLSIYWIAHHRPRQQSIYVMYSLRMRRSAIFEEFEHRGTRRFHGLSERRELTISSQWENSSRTGLWASFEPLGSICYS